MKPRDALPFALGATLLCAVAAMAQSPVSVPAGPRFELRPGESYFRVDGRPQFVLGRNPAGMNPKAYDEHFRHAAEAGERFVRIHFTYVPPGEKPGEIDAGMLKSWDAILDAAEARGLAVLPVLGIWSEWNDGSRKEHWHRWDRNPFNAALGGPAKRPDELLDDTPCRALWMKRLDTFVRRWSGRRAIVGWEVFSELDLITGSTEERAVAFAECAAAVVRAADPRKRPVTASQAGVCEWPKLLRSAALDFIEVHPYAGGPAGGRLDELILTSVRARLATYGKPVLIGECGLSAAPPRGTLDTAPRAATGIRHAVWAAAVSGAMNGRMLWWQDGYDQFEKADLCSGYQTIAAPAAAFVRGVDRSDFAPVPCEPSPGLKGAAIGHDLMRLAWFRDARCQPPEWPENPVSGASVTMAAIDGAWRAEFTDPATGAACGAATPVASGGRLRVVLPEFRGSIAVKLTGPDVRPATGNQP